MERITIDIDRAHLCVGDPDSLGIAVLVKAAVHIEPGGRRRSANELDYHLVADERLATPVLRDEGEKPMLDAVPFAGPRRVV